MKTLLIKLCALLILINIMTGSAFAEAQKEVSSIRTNGVTIDKYKILSQNNSAIQLSFTINNNDSTVYPELWYSSELYLKTSNNKSNLINSYYIPFNIMKLENKETLFTHSIPVKIPEGEYIHIMRILDRGDNVRGLHYQEIGKLGSGSSFLSFELETSQYKGKDTHSQAHTGPTFQKNEEPVLQINVKNLTTQPIETSVRAAVYQRSEYFQPLKLYESVNAEKYSFQSGESKRLDIKLPSFSEPGSYLADLIFEDNSGNRVSGIIGARYVIGGISAKIVDNVVKYKDGIITAVEKVVGPADETILKGAELKIKVIDENGQVAYSSKKVMDISLFTTTAAFEIPWQNKFGQITVVSEIYYQNNLLDTHSLKYDISELGKMVENTKQAPGILKDIENTPYAQAVYSLVAQGIVKGYADHTFRPENSITRAEFTTMIFKMLNNGKEAEKANGETLFADLKKSHWAFDIINQGVAMGILSGYPDRTFCPNKNVSYAEALTVCVKLLNAEEENITLVNWPDDFIKVASDKGLAADISYKPRDFATRGNIAIIVQTTQMLKSILDSNNK